MRFFALIALTFFMAVPIAHAEFDGKLATYSQLMSMSRDQRIVYMDGVRQLMVMLERQHQQYERAEYFPGEVKFREQVAVVIDLFQLVPSAHAVAPSGDLIEDDDSVDQAVKAGKTPKAPAPTTAAKPAPTQPAAKPAVTVPTVAAPVPRRTSRVTAGDPDNHPEDDPDPVPVAPGLPATRPSSASTVGTSASNPPPTAAPNTPTSNPPPAASSSNGKVAPGKAKPAAPVEQADKSETTGNPPGPKEVKQAPRPADSDTSSTGVASCSIPKFNCADKSSQDRAKRQKEINSFRKIKGADDNVCIAGGFFSEYKTPSAGRVRGGCEIPNKFPWPSTDNEKPVYSCPGGSNEALCNPLLFCLHVSQNDTAPLRLTFHCEAYGGSAGSNITERCDKWYEERAGEKTFKTAKGETYNVRPCDPKDALDKMTDPVQTKAVNDAWTQLKNSLEKNYAKYCMKNEKGFQALFCSECDVMAKHIYAMNKEALGSGCADQPQAKSAPQGAGQGGKAEAGR